LAANAFLAYLEPREWSGVCKCHSSHFEEGSHTPPSSSSFTGFEGPLRGREKEGKGKGWEKTPPELNFWMVLYTVSK